MFRYEMSNCLFEATMQRIESECKCVDKYFAVLIKEQPVCTGQKKLCMTNLKQTMGDTRSIMDRGVKKVCRFNISIITLYFTHIYAVCQTCLAACEDQKYRVLVTQATYPNLQSFVKSEDFCMVYNKLKKACGNDHRKSLTERYPDLCPVLEAHESARNGGCKSKNFIENPLDVNSYTGTKFKNLIKE